MSSSDDHIERPRFLWIDQICINQGDDREKGHQVQFMGEIFRRAEVVFAWLGVEDVESRFTIDWMRKQKPAVLQLSFQEQENLWAFFSRSYWSRLWIVQELILAREVVFICGHATFTWRDLQKVCLGDDFMSYNAPKASALCRLYIKTEPATLLSALRSIHGKAPFQCELPQDVVYGLLGLVPPSERILADYSMTLEDLIVNILEHCLPYLKTDDPYGSPYVVAESGWLLINVCLRAMDIPCPEYMTYEFLRSKVVKYFPGWYLDGEDFLYDSQGVTYGRR
jgi:hypothetical protein